jgi:hypothetical protein
MPCCWPKRRADGRADVQERAAKALCIPYLSPHCKRDVRGCVQEECPLFEKQRCSRCRSCVPG